MRRGGRAGAGAGAGLRAQRGVAGSSQEIVAFGLCVCAVQKSAANLLDLTFACHKKCTSSWKGKERKENRGKAGKARQGKRQTGKQQGKKLRPKCNGTLDWQGGGGVFTYCMWLWHVFVLIKVLRKT